MAAAAKRLEAWKPPPKIPGEDELDALAEHLIAEHQRAAPGHLGGQRHAIQGRLLGMLRSGELRPDGAPATRDPSATFSEVTERHAGRCRIWASGEAKPMNLTTFLGSGPGTGRWHEPAPESKRAPPNKAKEWNPGVTPERLARAQAKLARRLDSATNEGGNGT